MILSHIFSLFLCSEEGEEGLTEDCPWAIRTR